MKYIATTLEGLEDIAIKELKGKEFLPGIISFEKEVKSPQSIIKVYKYITHFTFKDKEELSKKIKNINLSNIKEPFVVRCEKKRKYLFKSLTIEQEIGEHIFKTYNKSVSLKDPKTILTIIIKNNTAIIAEDLSKEKLNRRDYRVQLNSLSLNPIIANAMTQNPNSILDPFCNTGEILIEAALKGGKDLHGLDKNPYNITRAKFNAKIAKADVTFSTADLDWIETKFEEKSIDQIITCPPVRNKRYKSSDIKKLYKELFEQVYYVLKGTLTILHPETQKLAPNNFKLINSRIIYTGERKYLLSTFEKTYK